MTDSLEEQQTDVSDYSKVKSKYVVTRIASLCFTFMGRKSGFIVQKTSQDAFVARMKSQKEEEDGMTQMLI